MHAYHTDSAKNLVMRGHGNKKECGGLLISGGNISRKLITSSTAKTGFCWYRLRGLLGGYAPLRGHKVPMTVGRKKQPFSVRF